MKNRLKNKVDLIIAGLIIVVALGLRLYKIDTPLADYHSWRQVDTAAVARNYVRNGINLLLPRYDDLSSIETGKENPQGYRMVEFPAYNALIALAAKNLPWLSLEMWGRLITALFSLVIIAILYYLVLQEYGRTAAVFSALTYAIFPFFVFFSRVILPETPALAIAFLAILALYLALEKKTKPWLAITLSLISSFCFALAILMKPTVIFYGITLAFIFFRRYGIAVIKKWRIYGYFFLSAIPFLLWRHYISAYPEGIPANLWLIAQVNTYQGLQTIFFRPAFFRWIFFERIGQNMFGVFLSFFVLLGVLGKTKKFLLHSLLLSSLAYLFVFQGGNVQHEYYQTLILPAVAVMAGLGVNHLFKNRPVFAPLAVTVPATLVIFALSLFFSYYRVRDFYNYPPELPQIAKIVRLLTQPTDKIITDRMGDTTLLYLTDRKGSPAIYQDLEKFKQENYKYLVTLNPETIKTIKGENRYPVIFENNQFALFAL
ncbi:glycosyltransferase family 39 protein [Patescibacteria group bacterium]|nr:glycosyltransferase family 39 protein [Patescibacteria group bacterium]MCL5091217.1 glycosyltransferase family 39 protein [Patescibacteria group bacterium]